MPCDQSQNWREVSGSGQSAVSYCCDPNATECCSQSSWSSVPVGTIIRNAVSSFILATTTSSSISTSMPTSYPPTLSDPTSPPISTSTQISTADSISLQIGLGVGLGLGLPIALALIGLLGFLVWETRKLTRHNGQHDTRPILESTAQRFELE